MRRQKEMYEVYEAMNEKREGEKEQEGERERKVIDGRRRLPEDYTSRRLQFTPFGKLDIHRAAFSTRLTPSSSPFLTVDEWNTLSPEFQTALQIESGPLWIFRRSRGERNWWSFEEEAMGVFAHSRDKGDLKGQRGPTGTNQLHWMNNVPK